MTPDMTTGWVDTATGQSGTFDKDGKPRSWTWRERVKCWWDSREMRRIAQNQRYEEARAKRVAEVAEEKRRQEDWHYEGLAGMRHTYSWGDGPKHTHDYKTPVYANHSLKEAYIIDPTDGGKHASINYDAYKDGGHVICV